MILEAFSFEIFIKAFLRIFPIFLIIKTPEGIVFSLYSKIFLTFILSLALYGRLLVEGTEASLYHLDLLMGLCVGSIVCLFFSASLKFSYFFSKGFQVTEYNSWKILLDSFAFIVLVLFCSHLKIERSLLNILALGVRPENFTQKIMAFDFWSKFLTDVCFLGLKVSSFGFIFVMSKKFFDEVYIRIGGEEMRLVFSLSFFTLLLVFMPFLYLR